MRRGPLLIAASTVALAFGAASFAIAAEKGEGKGGETPGHEMQEHGSVPGSPGASGYAPGHNKDADDVRGRQTTGAGDRDRDDRKLKGDRYHDRDDVKMKGDRDHDRDGLKSKRDRD